ncbi:hypothetical protein NQ036_06915 [Brevibacterium sp. 91QC2O2]|uniref:hypothetical protein n=1 Tax=Brevibacterium sp. 91QC2O2 TaxID=2968458 RepID=UPI00211C0E54|nr:hypothetical protein [Brevibacterium sp. 91QC2O2]MCQ9367975.1 hypothetical protein [Brevibacterium sp. 91QC2O2]
MPEIFTTDDSSALEDTMSQTINEAIEYQNHTATDERREARRIRRARQERRRIGFLYTPPAAVLAVTYVVALAHDSLQGELWSLVGLVGVGLVAVLVEGRCR